MSDSPVEMPFTKPAAAGVLTLLVTTPASLLAVARFGGLPALTAGVPRGSFTSMEGEVAPLVIVVMVAARLRGLMKLGKNEFRGDVGDNLPFIWVPNEEPVGELGPLAITGEVGRGIWVGRVSCVGRDMVDDGKPVRIAGGPEVRLRRLSVPSLWVRRRDTGEAEGGESDEPLVERRCDDGIRVDRLDNEMGVEVSMVSSTSG